MTTTPIKRALLSVADKTGIVEFAKTLNSLKIEIISTGGTSHALKAAGISHQLVEDLTGFPEIFDGRVKTLHPMIHAGILGNDKHQEEKKKLGIEWIDLVVVNFYPFSAHTHENLSWDEMVEYIDVGGPTMVRAAAKNFARVTVVTDPNDYSAVLEKIQMNHEIDLATRILLAKKAFAMTANYDATIHQYFCQQTKEPAAETLQLTLEQKTELRYGENPHQKAWAFRINGESGILSAHQHQGKPLSYNNLLDGDAALLCVQEFNSPAAVIIKHANPCGVATANTIEEAYDKAYQADPLSAFGGIIALNRTCTKAIAEAIAAIFMEVVIAPHFSEEALAVFALKPNLRVLSIAPLNMSHWERRFISGGMLLQEKDKQNLIPNNVNVVTQQKPTDDEVKTLLFAWQVVKHIKSNGILIAKGDATKGVGAGQVSRVDAVLMAIQKAGKHASQAVLASDAFFPFRDSIDYIAKAGISAIIQPGGSVRDSEVIAACNEHGIAMMFTGLRCFKH